MPLRELSQPIARLPAAERTGCAAGRFLSAFARYACGAEPELHAQPHAGLEPRAGTERRRTRIEDADSAASDGFGWDGRFNRMRNQASFPPFNPNEMDNKDAAAVLSKLERAAYAARFREVFGDNILAGPAKAFTQAMYATERFELKAKSSHPYTCKLDYYLDGKVRLAAHELRDKKLFDEPARGIRSGWLALALH